MLKLNKLSLRRGARELIHSASCIINAGQRVGLTGANGCGKSSLFALIRQELQADGGDCSLPPRTIIAHVAQETPAVDCSALDYVIDGDSELRRLQKNIHAAENADDGEKLAHLYHDLETIDGYSAASRAGKLMHGLGFNSEQELSAVNIFSGGWRMRLNLAQALMCRSDLLLLDEPTNHLDLEAVLWLEEWLINYPGTLLIISHDRDFLDRVTSHIAHLDNKDITLYKGNYSDFEVRRAEQLANQQSMYDKQQREIAHMQQFITRFKAKASKARQARSRVKALENMSIIQAAHVDSPFSFQFRTPARQPDSLVQLKQVAIGYTEQAILSGISMNIQTGSRIGLLGYNGAGKSTLIKLLANELAPLSGELTPAKELNIGYFAQHQLEQLDSQASPLLHLQRLNNKATEKELRNFLGGFAFNGDMATSNVAPFSGGEKARLVLAMIVYQKPNLLLLDEPTNHLDLEMRHALSVALQAFEGAMIIVSHDRHLLRTVTDQLLLVDSGQVTEFDGDLEDYRRWVNEQAKQEKQETQEKIGSDEKQGSPLSKKAQRQSASELRKKTQPMRNKLKKIEQVMDSLSEEKDQYQEQLASSEIYEEGAKAELKVLLEKQSVCQKKIEEAEEVWIQLTEELDSLET
ncbi:Bis-ABC ATPase YheS [hydrothermal vent metagenome]|uniref:Bis-ABC ATPase YheS n=1 Tax=hydrothermal vent metagenome TaxID=652676 RepID=A0A3B0Z2G8_9ZZZZ